MVGPDKDGSLATTQAYARDRGIAARVTFTGGIPKADVPRQFDRADIFLNTATIDNAPVSVMEAMAAGLCIVSTDTGGLPHLLTHDHDALLVPPGDAEAMAAAVRRLVGEPGLAERLSRNARATAEKHAWDRVLPLWEALLARVAVGAPALDA
jgi:glycosyltransferase involved in cell wall biosynthesis